MPINSAVQARTEGIPRIGTRHSRLIRDESSGLPKAAPAGADVMLFDTPSPMQEIFGDGGGDVSWCV